MSLWQKKTRPVDRAVEELNRQIAQLQRQLRQAEQTDPARPAAAGPAASAPASVAKFMKDMLAPGRERPPATYHARADLFDVGPGAMQELEVEPAGAQLHAPAVATGPSLQQYGAPITAGAASAQAQEKLAHYLSAGTFRNQRPVRRAQRQHRNRFFMWIGLSFVALWVLYVVVR
jgi:hypothetical protein